MTGRELYWLHCSCVMKLNPELEPWIVPWQELDQGARETWRMTANKLPSRTKALAGLSALSKPKPR